MAGATLARASVVGRYVVLGLVGRGATGEVYAAYDPELDRKVAIKLMRASTTGLTGADTRARLMREAQAIAKVSHPNVVVVFDVGTFVERVFVAMEFVEGHTLHYWLNAEDRPWPDVVKVFVEAGRGLLAAHEKDIVHRDFKPENVMLSASGHVRVMDFGLARVTSSAEQAALAWPRPRIEPLPTVDDDTIPADLEATISRDLVTSTSGPISLVTMSRTGGEGDLRLTQSGLVLGTPAYMSPEQFAGHLVTAKADQFSFCVALYEALYHERPFEGRNFHELSDNVAHGRVGAAPGRTDVPPWLRRILLRGLAVNASERWPGMRELLGELERDRLGGGRERFAEGAARRLAHVWEVPVDGQAAESRVRGEVRAAFEATGKRYAAAAFETVCRTLDAFAVAWTRAYVDACEATHMRGDQSAEVLDLRMAFLDQRRDELRVLTSMFRRADADVVENAVKAVGALGGLERVSDLRLLRSIVPPPHDPRTEAAVNDLRAQLAEARMQSHVGRRIEALRALEPLERAARTLGYAPLVAEVLLEKGRVHAERLDAAIAAVCLEEALWTAERVHHDEIAAEAATYLVYVVGDTLLRFEAGEIWARHAEMLIARLGGRDRLLGWLFNNRCAMRERQGRPAEALEDARMSVAAKERALGPDSADVALSLSNLALVLEQLGQADEGIRSLERAVSISMRELGLEHPNTAVLQSNYSELLNRSERYADARLHAEQALKILGTDDDDSLTISYPLIAAGLARLGLGDAEGALPLVARASAIRDAKEGEPGRRAEAHFALARALWDAGRDRARARGLAQQAREEQTASMHLPGVPREAAAVEAWLAGHCWPADNNAVVSDTAVRRTDHSVGES